jgi:hypothetical protein
MLESILESIQTIPVGRVSLESIMEGNLESILEGNLESILEGITGEHPDHDSWQGIPGERTGEHTGEHTGGHTGGHPDHNSW